MAVLVSILVSIFAARRITNPLQVLTQSSRALARGDFSQRVNLWSRTEIGELAHTFNTMSDELEHFVEDLKRAAEENRELFMGSIQMLAGAVDEKDPYTRGHSDRVTRYSLLIAKEMKQPESFLETLRISAQLHDVGKIGIEDHILKKPGALTEEEFEVMKTHTTKGANILRPVTQLAEMLPGIELHHEALDGRGYPYGLQGDQIPLLARVIAVADTFDALTTNRPYQQAHTPDQALQIIKNLAGKRLDPEAVDGTACRLRTRRNQNPALHHQAPDRAAGGGDSGGRSGCRCSTDKSRSERAVGKNPSVAPATRSRTAASSNDPLQRGDAPLYQQEVHGYQNQQEAIYR